MKYRQKKKCRKIAGWDSLVDGAIAVGFSEAYGDRNNQRRKAWMKGGGKKRSDPKSIHENDAFKKGAPQTERQAVLPQPKHKKRLRMMRLRRRPVTAM